jgi:ferredoxin
MNSVVVVGTGPAGWASVLTLIENGIKPLVLDIAGQTTDSLNRSLPSDIKGSGMVKKSFNGSTSMYEYPLDEKISFENLDSIPISSELGGLSTVWGSNIQSLQEGQEIAWGKDSADVNQSIKEILKHIPHSGSKDSLEGISKWPLDFPDQTPNSPRVKKILKRSEKVGTNSKWRIGQARNATAGSSSGCVLCGKCLTGCPERVIFSTSKFFEKWILQGKIDFKRFFVQKITQSQNQWVLHGLDPATNIEQSLRADKVILATGSIATTVLLRNSNFIPQVSELSDTQVFYFPLFSFRDSPKNCSEYALAQIFVSSKDSVLEKSAFHYSLYENSETIKSRVSSIYPNLSKLIPGVIFKQILSGIGFIHSSVSGKIEIRQVNDHISVQGIVSDNSRKAVWRTFFTTFWSLVKIGLLPIPIFVTPSVGSSYHVGVLCSGDSKVLTDGKLENMTNLFCVDGSALPILPTGPTTLLIMGNSRRITKKMLGSS